MAVLTYEYLALQWTPVRKRDHSFNVLATIIVAGLLFVAIVISSIKLPEEERKARTVVPERIAKFILQKEKPKNVKPKPIPKPKIRLKPKRTEALKKPLTKNQKKARNKAADSGLLALGNELSDLIDTRSIDAMVGRKLSSSSLASKKASVNTNILTDDVNRGSGGISVNDVPTLIGKTVLDNKERLELQQSIMSSNSGKVDKPKKRGYRGEGLRSEEEIAIVMDQNKSQLHSLYRRARRTDPGLKGKIVLAITILPSGQVSKIEVRSSELKSPRLEARIIARIKRFNFGDRGVETVTVTYPIEFLPS